MRPLTLPMLLLAWSTSLCLFFPHLLTAQKPSNSNPYPDTGYDLFLQVKSYEAKEVSGKLQIPVSLTAMRNLNLAGMELGILSSDLLPEGKVITQSLPQKVLEPGATLQTSIILSYDPKRLPFHHQSLRLGVRSPGEKDWRCIANAYLYFTPYGTVELWNTTDFDNLKRVWISRLDLGGKRLPLSRKEIPVSDLNEEEWLDDNFPKEYLFRDGLAYGIPMKAKPQKKTTNAKSGQLYSGNIRGRIVTHIDGDTIALSDIRVDVYNKKGGKIETTWTDEFGNFEIFVINLSLNADSLELYVKVHSINEAETIRVRGRGLGPTRKEFYLKKSPFLWHYQAGDVEMGDIETDKNELKGQLLHWANRARHFVEEELSNANFSLPDQPGDKLEIMTHPWQQDMGGMFMPAAVEGQLIAGGAALIPFPLSLLGIIVLENNLSNKDCLYIGKDFEEQDGTVSHEFGHYLMWHLQDQHWASILKAGLANHTKAANNNTPDLAWTEGFANGFEEIMQTVNLIQGHTPVSADGLESDIWDIDHYYNYEDDIYVIDIGGGNTRNDQALDHGFVSEYYVGKLIYDLWDGPNKFSAIGLNDFYYQDYEGAVINDSTELDFFNIVKPILDHPGVGLGVGLAGFNQAAHVINSIPEYHEILLFEQSFDCLELREINDLFKHNKIHNIMDNVYLNFPTQKNYLNLDAISFLGEVETNRYNITNGSPAFKLDGTNVDLFKLDVFELSNSVSHYNLYSLGPDAGFVQLIDDLEVSGGAHLYLNKEDNYAWLDPANQYGQSITPGILPPTQNLDVEICSGMTMEVLNGGALIVGDPGSNKRAEIRFKSGSTFILGKDGQLLITNNSRLIIEPGATFIYEEGAEIILSGGTSILQIEGEWILEQNATFSFEGWGFVRTDLPDNNGGPNITHLPGASIALIGNQKDEHKMLEVVAGSHFMTQTGDCQMSVTFANGIIEMGTDAKIDVTDSFLYTDQLWVRSIPGSSGKHKGISVNRAPTGVSYTDIYDGKIGLSITMDPALMTCQSTAGNATIFHSNFIDCRIGLLTQGGSVHLAAVTFQQNRIGWRARDIQGDCQIGNNLANYHDVAAYDLAGDSKSHTVSVSSSVIVNNREGLKGDMGLQLDLNCDSIANNVIGLRIGNDVLLSMNDEAYNYVGGNNRSILLKNARGIDLENGYNTLENTSLFGVASKAIEGSLMAPPTTVPIPADYNYWKQSILSPASSPPTAAIAELWLHGSPTTTYTFSDPTPLSYRIGGPYYCQYLAGAGQPVPGGSKIDLPNGQLPVATLGQNVPNPSQGVTRIPYYLPEQVHHAEILVFDLVTGRKIERIPILERGEGEILLQRRRLNAGVYSYTLLVDGEVINTRKMVWVD